MNEAGRQQVLDSARYLRQVRPLDPEELADYVTGGAHPAAVRQVLRDHATALGVVEREDGAFVPVGEGPVAVEFPGVEALPDRHARFVEDRLVERFGPGWPDGETGDRLRERTREIKARYLRGAPVEYDEVTALAYAVYHLPATYAAAQYLFADLAREGLLSTHLRVLDVGAGVGGPALGLCDLLPGEALVEYHAVEPGAGADLLAAALADAGRNVHPTVHRERAEAFDPGAVGPVDLLLFGNVLSELADPAGTVARYLAALADDGTAVAVAPADRETATGLRETERAVEREAGATVYAPTLRLWPDRRPVGTCWSFTRKPNLATPGFQRRLDGGERAREPPEGRRPGDGEFVNTDVQYAYSVLRTDGRRRVDYRPDPDRVAPMADSESHVTDRIDCVGVKLSPDLGSDNPLFLVGDGSERRDHFAVRAEGSALNRALVESPYGGVLSFENALLLWNDDEAAYNLVVDGETVVDRVG